MHSKIMLSVACRCPDTQVYKTGHLVGTLPLRCISENCPPSYSEAHVSVMLTPLTHGEAMLEHSRDA